MPVVTSTDLVVERRSKVPLGAEQYEVHLPLVGKGPKPPLPFDLGTLREQFLVELNQYRILVGISGDLALHPGLCSAAGIRAQQVVDLQSKDGSIWHHNWFEAVKPFYPYGRIGEVLQGGYEPNDYPLTGETVLQGFFTSASHKALLLKPDRQHIGLGKASGGIFDFVICVIIAGRY